MSSPALNAHRLVGLVARNSPDFFDRLNRLVAEGACVVPLRSAEDGYRIAATGVEEIVTPAEGSGWTGWTGTLAPGEELAQVAFTSGTQGEPKGVLLTRANLADTVRRLGRALGLDAAARFYIGAPVYHSFGGGCARAVAAAGGRSYVPKAGFNPREVAALLERGEINGIAAVPTQWRTLLQNEGLLGDRGARVRWVLIGSQPMTRDEKLAMRRLFPNARILHHYGLTEASSSVFLDVSAVPEALLDAAGAPLFGVEVRITQDGRIAIRGPHVAQRLLVGGTLVPNVDPEGWFVTNDAGEIRDGHLFFLGRVDDVINAGGLKVSADAIEEALVATLGTPRQIGVARIPDRDRGDGVLVAVVEACALPDREILAAAAAVLRENGLDAASALRIMRVPDLPRTENDKLRRVALAEDFARRTAAGSGEAAPAGAGGPRRTARRAAGWLAALRAVLMPGRDDRGLHAVYAEIFPGTDIRDTDSFVSLGGDSLKFVALSIALEERLGHLPENWQTLSIAELRAVEPRRTVFRKTDTTLVLRFIGIVSVVHFHFMPDGIGGATFLLMVAVGYNFARFQFPNLLARDSVAPLLMSTFRIALPLLLVIALIEARKGELQPLTVLLLGNFIPAAERTLDYWFVEVTVQIMLILAALLAIPAVRRVARAHQLAFGYGLLAVSVALAKFGPLVWDTTPYFDRMPHMILWLFVLGMVIEAARTPLRRLMAAALVGVLPLVVWGTGDYPFWIDAGPAWLWIGGLVLLVFDDIPLPAALSRAAYYVGGASMFIYITHFSVLGLRQAVFPVEPGPVDVAVAIAAGVLIWLAWEAAARALPRRLRLPVTHPG